MQGGKTACLSVFFLYFLKEFRLLMCVWDYGLLSS